LCKVTSVGFSGDFGTLRDIVSAVCFTKRRRRVKLLIIEDDPEIVESVFMAFRMRWPSTHLTSTDSGEEGIELAEGQAPDIIILDLGLPDISGFDVLKQIRVSSSVPIIILTVKGEECDIVKGLELGADDYIIKPCGQLELLARVNARMRDIGYPANEPSVSFGLLRLSVGTHQLFCGEREIGLTALETRIIQFLINNEGRVATYSGLVHYVWGDEYPGCVDSLRVHIRRLREKIEADPSHPQVIINRPGAGYCLAHRA